MAAVAVLHKERSQNNEQSGSRWTVAVVSANQTPDINHLAPVSKLKGRMLSGWVVCAVRHTGSR